jgi:hypothetical protein
MASTILELAASMVRIFEQKRLRCRRVARRTVRAATGGTVEVRMRRPAGRLQAAATVR